jgi:hypothetical protein
MTDKVDDTSIPRRSITLNSNRSTLQADATAEPPSERRPQMERGQSGTLRGMAHDEHHSNYGNVVRDVIIGFADGLTVPFALTAGLSS